MRNMNNLEKQEKFKYEKESYYFKFSKLIPRIRERLIKIH